LTVKAIEPEVRPYSFSPLSFSVSAFFPPILLCGSAGRPRPGRGSPGFPRLAESQVQC
jgi:hypothetical protein